MTEKKIAIAFGFVNWPEPTIERRHHGPDQPKEGIYDTGEGGLECWAIAITSGRDYASETRPNHVRDVCITDFSPAIITWDAVPTDWFSTVWSLSQREQRRFETSKRFRMPHHYRGASFTYPLHADGAVCLGATNRSLWDYAQDNYWHPDPLGADLTEEGQQAFLLMQRLYGYDSVHIVMALDT